MNDYLIIDVSFPDDIFLINIKVEALVDEGSIQEKKVYQLSYEADDKFIGILEVDKDISGCKLTGKVKLSDFQIKLIHEAIMEKIEETKPKKGLKQNKVKTSSRIW